ncbi:MAG: 4-hydroxy-tetrahydrodipicolinate synthase [Bacteroidales bacterium]|jgi:4-hydroxy-tetrahydrodipicolinate synthase|nr:4-hydroxy-tetrahydrodipicolinate synthase [Bacteroidales bacterium]
MDKLFSGTGVALITPFKKDFSIDFDGIEMLVNRLINNGINYIVTLGTTAETPSLSFSERKKIVDTVVETVRGRIPVVVGIGANNPLAINEQLHLFDLSKVSAILSVTPYYNRPQQKGLAAYFKVVAEQSPLPVIIYNVPARTGVNMEAATSLHIAKEIPNVIGIKEASGNMGQIMEIIRHKPKHFLVISGDDAITLPLIACGANGVISVIANAFPKDFSDMVRLALAGNFDQAQKLHYQLLDYMTVCFRDGTPSGIKAFLQEQHLIDDYLRLPLVPVQDETRRMIQQLLKTS